MFNGKVWKVGIGGGRRVGKCLGVCFQCMHLHVKAELAVSRA
jgi:hypothetical protein